MSNELRCSDTKKSNTNESVYGIYDALPQPETTIIPPILKGKLKKKHPRNKKKLQDRWLSLFEDRMTYAREKMGTPVGEIALEGVRAEIITNEKNYAFELSYDSVHQRQYQFVAKTDVDRALWVWKINCCAYLKYGRTRRPLSDTTITYLRGTMGIDKIKTLLSMGYKAASEHFLSCSLGHVGPEKLQKASSQDSQVSTSSDAEEKACRATITDTDYLEDYTKNEEVEDLEDAETFGGFCVDIYFDPREAHDNEDNSQLPLALHSTLSRQRTIFSTAEVMSSKGSTMLPVNDADDEPNYLDRNSVNNILDVLDQDENPCTVLPDVADIPPLPERDPIPSSDHRPVHYITNALKKVIHAPSAAHANGSPTTTSRSAEKQYNADILERNKRAEKNPCTVHPDLDDIPPLPKRDQTSDHSPVHCITNAHKKVIHAPSATHGPPMTTNRSAESQLQFNTEDVIKVRCAGQTDFIEVDRREIGTTYDSLIRCFAEEIQLSTEDILLVRKLPDILVRSDRDVRRIIANQKFELQLRK